MRNHFADAWPVYVYAGCFVLGALKTVFGL